MRFARCIVIRQAGWDRMVFSQQRREDPRYRIPEPHGSVALLILCGIELGAVHEVTFEVLLQFLSEPLAVEYRIDFVVDAEAADVDIRRADRADLGIDADCFGVQVTLLVKEHAYAGGDDISDIGVPRPIGESVA
jgi:hypothetical protein